MAGAIAKCQILLQSLDLSRNKIGPKAATNLGNALSCNSLLSTLQLEQNEIGPTGAVGLAKGLVSQTLTSLSVAKNNIGDQGQSAKLQSDCSCSCLDPPLRKYVSSPSTYRCIKFRPVASDAKVAAKGCEAIAKLLKFATALKRLDLGGNGVGDVGGAAIAAALPSLTTLTTLDLQDNALGDHAGVAMGNALARNSGLLTLSLRANLVRDATGSALVAALRSNDSLTELDVSWNDINFSNHESIQALLQEQAARCVRKSDRQIETERQCLFFLFVMFRHFSTSISGFRKITNLISRLFWFVFPHFS